jgi:hypothetical protein
MLDLIIGHYQEVLAALVAILSGLIGIFMVIPGDQPEKTLQAIVDFIKKFSIKK